MIGNLSRQLLAGVAAVAVAVSLSGCHGNASGVDPKLEATVKEASEKAKLDSLPGKELFSDFKIKAEAPATLVYEYTYKDSINTEEMKTHLEQNAKDNLRTVAENIKQSLVAEGVKDAKVTYRYLDHSGKVVWEHTF
ncbi:MAG: DUF4854 domain-containing protein [Actinomycetaceae bacterium]|nr:DUF4854 domain-containing protein [Actinomycetaceae bacterium]